jgi:hypothetical protein
MTLAYKRWAGEVPEVEGLDLAGPDSGVGHRFPARIDGKGSNIPVGENPERRFAKPNYRYPSHTTIRIAPR